MDGYEFLLHLITTVLLMAVLIYLTRLSSKRKIPQAIGGQSSANVDRYRNIVRRCADSQRLSPSCLPRTNALFPRNGLLQTPSRSENDSTELQTKENPNPDLEETRSFAGERSKFCAKDTLTLSGQKSSTPSVKIPTESSLDNAGPSNDEDRQNVENKSTTVAGIDENLEDPSIATKDTPLVQDQQRVDISGNVDFDDIDHSVPVKDLIPTQASPLEDVPYPDCVILKRTHWEILKRSLEKMLRELSLPFEEEIDFGDSYDEKAQKPPDKFDEADLIMDYVQNHFAPGNVDAEVRACPIPPCCEVCNHHEHDSICVGCGLHLCSGSCALQHNCRPDQTQKAFI